MCARACECHVTFAFAELWLACCQDRRISVWNAHWSQDHNELIEWLTLAAPPFEPTAELQVRARL